MNKYLRIIWTAKEGIVIGIISAIAVAYYLKTTGTYSFEFAMASSGLLDKAISAAQPLKEIAFKKTLIALVISGAVIGGMIDYHLTRR